MRLRRDAESGLEIDTCPECQGMWFDGDELSRFLQGGSLRREFARVAEAEPLQSVGFTIDTRVRRCPRCRTALGERLHGGVTLDVCQACRGIFLDDGELRRITAQYEKGDRGEGEVRDQLDRGYGREAGGPPVLGAVLAFLKRFTAS